MPNERMQQWLAEFGVPREILAMVKGVVAAIQAPPGDAAAARGAADGVGGIMADALRQATAPHLGPLEAAAARRELPRPMQSDCHPVRDKAPGPHNHQLCAKHGHIVDIGKRMIIAESVLDYKKRFRDELTKTAKTVGAAAIAAVGAVPGGKAVIAAAEGALAETTKLPRPIQPDCKLVPLKGGAPENIYLCTAHGHIIDVKQTAIIANDRKSYEADAAGAKAVGKLVEKVVGVVKEGMAAAKEQAAFEAAARKRAELDKAVGVVPVAISLLVEGPDGPVSDLDLVADAMADGGVGEGTWYGLPLRETSAGIYVGEAAPLPPTGILAIGQAGVGMGGFAVQTATFDPLRYTAAAHGVLHLTATENPGGANAKLRHFEVKIAA